MIDSCPPPDKSLPAWLPITTFHDTQAEAEATPTTHAEELDDVPNMRFVKAWPSESATSPLRCNSQTAVYFLQSTAVYLL